MQNSDTGKYYIGMHNGKNKNYQGSGKIFSRSYRKDPSKWSKTIIASDLDENQARWLERCLVGYEVVDDCQSYNLALGGYGGNSVSFSKESNDKRIANQLRTNKSAKTKSRRSAASKRTSSLPHVKQAKSKAMKDSWKSGKFSHRCKTGEANHNSKFRIIATEIGGERKLQMVGNSEMRHFGFEPSKVIAVCNGHRSSHKGFTFRKVPL